MVQVEIETREKEAVTHLIWRYELADERQLRYFGSSSIVLRFGSDGISQELSFWLKSAVACGLIDHYKEYRT